ncbi:hypothetical protein RJ640_016432 [Escallonia rubra]|uniref:ditrans,polycis-polyprenyl diphosphate synthase [(2E,6E)-farnesyldiphosphate specific] n=1 Tax=Escallonia rubra TaxID=112253 RepID=A0AA88UBP6_9ASTE|nr:hypothetical protein RJ640_016432 [Escallonia rubra]
MDLGEEIQKVYRWVAQSCNLGLFLLWHILHFIVTFWYFALRIANALESCLISSGLLKKYKALCSGKIQCLAIVMDSKDADQTSKVIELLQWLGALGVKYVCLYDTEGVLKKSKEAITGSGRFSHAKSSEKEENDIGIRIMQEAAKTDPLLDQEIITVEFASFSDGKAAVVKAANLLFVKYYLGGEQEEPILSESHVAEALEAIGCGGPDPDLLLVYGPGRCHLGFPAWRIRYTEIVHMGLLKSANYGSLVKAIYKFTMVRQNYESGYEISNLDACNGRYVQSVGEDARVSEAMEENPQFYRTVVKLPQPGPEKAVKK